MAKGAVLGVIEVGLMTPDALWYASEFHGPHEKLPSGMSLPSEIRRWFNDQQSLLQNTDPVLKEGPEPVGVPEFHTKNPRGYHERATQRLPPCLPLGFSRFTWGGGRVDALSFQAM